VANTQQDFRKRNGPHTFNTEVPLTQARTHDSVHFCNVTFCHEEFLSYLHLGRAEHVTVFFLACCGSSCFAASWMAALIWLTPDQWCF